MKSIKYIIACVLVVLSINTNYAVVAVTPANETTVETTTPTVEDAATPAVTLSKKEQRKLNRAKKIMNFIAKKNAKLEAKNAKRVAKGKKAKDHKKLLRIALLLWGGGLLLLILAVILAATLSPVIGVILWLLGGLAFLGGSITFIIWLVKRLS